MPSNTKPKLVIEIQYASAAIEKSLAFIASPALMKKWIKSAMNRGGLLTLRFVNSSEGKKLNLAFRKKDRPTNVLTFSYELTKDTLLADIIFCLPIIQKEAKEQDKSDQAHLAHLIVHGCFHAQGLDHESDKEAQKMEKQEIAVLQSLGFNNPYEEI
jgi:probable rRNA maturation factor